MQLRVDVSADGKVLATLADNELQVMRSSVVQSDSLEVLLPCLFELALLACTVGPRSVRVKPHWKYSSHIGGRAPSSA